MYKLIINFNLVVKKFFNICFLINCMVCVFIEILVMYIYFIVVYDVKGVFVKLKIYIVNRNLFLNIF